MEESGKDPLRSVWEEAAPELSRLVRAMGIEPARAEDVLQQVYLTAMEKHPPAAGRVELRRWLFRVTTNRCNLEHRRRTRWRNVLRGLASWGENSHHDASEAASRREQQQLVHRALDRLEPSLRSVLVLRYFAGFDSREIGHILQLNDSTVRGHLRTARRRLALELRRAGYDDD